MHGELGRVCIATVQQSTCHLKALRSSQLFRIRQLSLAGGKLFGEASHPPENKCLGFSSRQLAAEATVIGSDGGAHLFHSLY